MKKNAYYIAAIMAICIIITYVTNLNKQNSPGNSFVRRYVDLNITYEHSMLLDDNMFSFVGTPNEHIVLRNFHDGSRLFKTDFNLRNINNIKLKTPLGFDYKGANIFGQMLKDKLYLNNGLGHIVLSESNRAVSYKIKELNFDIIQPISENSLIMRERKNNGGHTSRELMKMTLSANPVIEKKHLLPKQIDGFFCTDGQLNFDAKNSNIIYMYYYRGEFLCLDTNLNMLYKGKTIDTVTTAKIKLRTVATKMKNGKLVNQTTQATPPTNLINRYAATYKENIYILSCLKADNETSDDFFGNQSIDVYSSKDGSYRYSFHVPKFKNQKMTEFYINGYKLAAIYGRSLVSFTSGKPF